MTYTLQDQPVYVPEGHISSLL